MIHARRRRKAEKQRLEADLQEQTDALWREELEWVRQNPNPPLRGFRAAIRKALARRKKYHFPPLNIAMWPGQLGCTIDVSDPEKFNDRYIEAPIPGRAGMNLPVLVTYIFITGFTYGYLHGESLQEMLDTIIFATILVMVLFFLHTMVYIFLQASLSPEPVLTVRRSWFMWMTVGDMSCISPGAMWCRC